jgi:hypothetical protein
MSDHSSIIFRPFSENNKKTSVNLRSSFLTISDRFPDQCPTIFNPFPIFFQSFSDHFPTMWQSSPDNFPTTPQSSPDHFPNTLPLVSRPFSSDHKIARRAGGGGQKPYSFPDYSF